MTPAKRWAEPRALVIVAVLAFAVLRLAALTRYPFWMDESWTMDVGSFSLHTTLRNHADDQSHPPLFYVLLWVWRAVGGDTLAWVRLLPALIGIATAVPVLALARAAGFSSRATRLAIVLGAGSAILVSYSVELRNYGLLALLTPASLALWLRARDRGDRDSWVALTVVNILMVHSHYFGVFVVVAEWIDALGWERKRFRGITASAAVTALSLVPWIAATAYRATLTGQRLENVGWSGRPAPGDALDLVTAAIGTTWSLAADLTIAVAVVAAVALWAFRVRGTALEPGVRLLLLAVVVPVVIAYVASVAQPKSLWLTRYLISVAPPLLLLLAGAIDGLLPARLTPVAFALAAVPAALTSLSLRRGTEKPRYDLILHQVADHATGGTAVIFFGQSWAMAYAAHTAAPSLSRPVSVRGVRGIAAMRPDSGWYFWNESYQPWTLPPPAELIRRGYRVGPQVIARSDSDSLVAVWFEKAPRAP